jgi:hypothetical protein
MLNAYGGIVSRAAHGAGLSERNFHEKMKKYGLCGKDFRAPHSHRLADENIRIS